MKHLRIIITCILFIFLYFPLFPQLVKEWLAQADYSHGFIIPLLSAYFIWKKKDELKNTSLLPSGIGIIFIAVGLIIYFLGKIGYQLFLQYFSMLIVLFGLVYAQAGKVVAKKTAFPIAYLIFMIPLPQMAYTTITLHLSLFSTQLAYFLIKTLGISATAQGNIIGLPTCQLFVAAPCSGLRSLVVFMAGSLAIGYIFQKNIKKRIALFILAIVLAILTNTIRLAATAFIANLLKASEVPQNVHDTTGIIATIAGLAGLYFINELLTNKK